MQLPSFNLAIAMGERCFRAQVRRPRPADFRPQSHGAVAQLVVLARSGQACGCQGPPRRLKGHRPRLIQARHFADRTMVRPKHASCEAASFSESLLGEFNEAG